MKKPWKRMEIKPGTLEAVPVKVQELAQESATIHNLPKRLSPYQKKWLERKFEEKKPEQ
ncbi:MAG: hypothetical protein NTY48_00375 [Candidatus Diapherotrites archaeon]|nr:hypothetical protein [Candidatus Diapherotrites archaeon]